MRCWGAGLSPRWRPFCVETLAAVAGLAMSPVTTMAASPLCPCPDIPEAPAGPLLVGAGVAAAGLVAALSGRRARRGRVRGLLARLAALLSVVVLLGAVCLVYNASADTLCVCTSPSPAVSPTAGSTPTPSDSPSPTPSDSPSPSASGSASPSPTASSGGGRFTGSGGGGAVRPLHTPPGDHHGVEGAVVGVPYTGLPGLASWPVIAVLAGTAAVGASVVIRRRRAGR
jgi:hypothetical protein